MEMNSILPADFAVMDSNYNVAFENDEMMRIQAHLKELGYV